MKRITRGWVTLPPGGTWQNVVCTDLSEDILSSETVKARIEWTMNVLVMSDADNDSCTGVEHSQAFVDLRMKVDLPTPGAPTTAIVWS